MRHDDAVDKSLWSIAPFAFQVSVGRLFNARSANSRRDMTISGRPFDDFRNLLDVMPEAGEQAVAAVRARDAQLTKPPGSLGRLEEIVEWLAAWQAKAQPTVERATVVVFAGNHGVTAQGVSPYPREVTKQMVANFGAGGAAVNQICATFGAGLKVFEMAQVLVE